MLTLMLPSLPTEPSYFWKQQCAHLIQILDDTFWKIIEVEMKKGNTFQNDLDEQIY